MNATKSVGELRQLMENMVSLDALINQKLGAIEFELRDIFESIKKSESLLEANGSFEKLQGYHDALSLLAFKHNFQLSFKLTDFVRTFERLDDHRLKQYMFEEIKIGHYSF